MPRPKQAYNLLQQSNRVAHTTTAYTTAARAQIQSTFIKNRKVCEDIKVRPQEKKLSAFQRSDNTETSKKTWKEIKNW